jgi:carboxylesterase type B
MPYGIAFRNVPFAAPPFGPRRFLPPQRPQSWHGLRDGSRPGASMPQDAAPIIPGVLGDYLTPGRQGEDALTLEIDTPAIGEDLAPVLVWVHPGGFVTGGASAAASSGATFARDGIVHVAVNHRLGIDGFLLLDDSEQFGSDNLGLRDLVAALEWVRENIASFGGDPDRVTVAGYGTGATLVTYLLASPLSTGLFHGAMLLGPVPQLALPMDASRRITDLVARAAARPATREKLSGLGRDETLAVAAAVSTAVEQDPEQWSWLSLIGSPFAGVVGTPSLPVAPIAAMAAGASADVPVLAGTNAQALGHILGLRLGVLGLSSPAADRLFARLHLDPETVAEIGRQRGPCGGDLGLATAVLTDLACRLPTLALLEAHRGDGFLYEFGWESPAAEEGLGALAGIDLPFWRDDLDGVSLFPRTRALYPDEPPRDLIDAMHSAAIGFICSGDPGWEPYSPGSRMTMLFSEVSALVPDAAGPMRRVWQGAGTGSRV